MSGGSHVAMSISKSKPPLPEYEGTSNWRRNVHPIVFACDGAFAMQLATTLRSLTEANNSEWPLDVHVLVDKFPQDAQLKILGSLPEGSVLIRWIPADLTPFQEFATGPFISKMTFARLLIPRLFPETVRRVLYLDADLLLFDDLGPLWETDLDGAVVGAVQDALALPLKHGGAGLEGIPRVENYFNAGVLLIDLFRWREKQISEKALKYLNQHPRSPFGDQDALNVACDGLWKKLDPKWNFQNHYNTRIADMRPTERPAIVHFVTVNKPWKPTSLSVNASLYDSFRNRTLFARTNRERLSDAIQTMWRRLKRGLRQLVDFANRSAAAK